jgi:transposase-like protein
MSVAEEPGFVRQVRRWRTVSEKRRIAELTLEPGASVALARAHGVNPLVPDFLAGEKQYHLCELAW